MGKELEKEQLTILENPVVVWTQVGKEFPDNRQNEREIKFIRVGDAVRTVGQLKGKPTLNMDPEVYTQGTRGGISSADWMRHIYWVGGAGEE